MKLIICKNLFILQGGSSSLLICVFQTSGGKYSRCLLPWIGKPELELRRRFQCAAERAGGKGTGDSGLGSTRYIVCLTSSKIFTSVGLLTCFKMDIGISTSLQVQELGLYKTIIWLWRAKVKNTWGVSKVIQWKFWVDFAYSVQLALGKSS